MKTIVFTAPLFILLTVGASCNVHKQKGVKETSIRISHGFSMIEIKYAGSIEISDDETGFKTISPDGYISYKGNNKQVTASQKDGKIVYAILEGNRQVDAETENGKKILAETINDIEEAGFDAKGSVERLYNKGGSAAILARVSQLANDEVKNTYLSYLLSKDNISQADKIEIARLIGSSMNSGYLKASLLKKFRNDLPGDAALNNAYLNAVKSIDTDIDKTNALSVILKDSLTPAQFDQILPVALTLRTDYDKATALKTLASGNIQTTDQWLQLINASVEINPEMERSMFLLGIADKMPMTDELKTAYLNSAKTIRNGTDYDKTKKAVL